MFIFLVSTVDSTIISEILNWHHNELVRVSNHQSNDCLLNRLFRRWSKKASKLRVTGLCAGYLAVAGEFPAQRASNAENVSIWWRHHEKGHSLLSLSMLNHFPKWMCIISTYISKYSKWCGYLVYLVMLLNCSFKCFRTKSVFHYLWVCIDLFISACLKRS